jgi:predicted ArsR family transcriptional regulator
MTYGNTGSTSEDAKLFAGGDTQQQLLSQLLDCKSGLTINEIADRLEISRSAVKQHLTGLERNGFVARSSSRKTGGRPGNLYVLTDAGIDSFPKKYSWFSRVLFERLRSKIGPGEFGRYMFDLGVDMSAAAIPRLVGKNCVYHDLSKDYVEVCQFDIGFISGLMGADIDHQECMQRGGQACRFRFKPLA